MGSFARTSLSWGLHRVKNQNPQDPVPNGKGFPCGNGNRTGKAPGPSPVWRTHRLMNPHSGEHAIGCQAFGQQMRLLEKHGPSVGCLVLPVPSLGEVGWISSYQKPFSVHAAGGPAKCAVSLCFPYSMYPRNQLPCALCEGALLRSIGYHVPHMLNPADVTVG